MAKKFVVLTSHMSSLRDSWWYLEQDEDGSLWVRHENDDDHSVDWRKPLHEAMAAGGTGFGKELQKRIDRMFEDPDA